ncbi:MAG: hypothetical protein U0441_27970 [Polyangiaceae bacterium]
MKTKTMVVGLFALLCGALSGCASKGSDGASSAAADRAVHSFTFGGAGLSAQSRVERTFREGGGEMLAGTTEVRLPGEPHPFVVRETATLDAAGRLQTATSELRAGQRAEDVMRTVLFDAAAGTITIRDAKGSATMHASADHPWYYVNPFSDIAPLASDATAVQAWIARRAAESATGDVARLRAIDVTAKGSFLTLANQVLMSDQSTAWVVLGDEVIETDADFVRALPWRSLESAVEASQSASTECSRGPV